MLNHQAKQGDPREARNILFARDDFRNQQHCENNRDMTVIEGTSTFQN